MDIKLKKGEIICDKCNGEGIVDNELPDKNYNLYLHKTSCPKCKGDGKLDWIENLVGKPMATDIFWDSIGTTTPGNNFNETSMKYYLEEMNKCFGVPKSFLSGEVKNINEEEQEKFKFRINKLFRFNSYKGENIE